MANVERPQETVENLRSIEQRLTQFSRSNDWHVGHDGLICMHCDNLKNELLDVAYWVHTLIEELEQNGGK